MKDIRIKIAVSAAFALIAWAGAIAVVIKSLRAFIHPSGFAPAMLYTAIPIVIGIAALVYFGVQVRENHRSYYNPQEEK